MKHTSIKLASGVVHGIPEDLRKALQSSGTVQNAWNSLTPLARNEWICWVTFVKKPETRIDHVRRVREDMLKGKRRPCCWLGCPHRSDKKPSRSVQGIRTKRSAHT